MDNYRIQKPLHAEQVGNLSALTEIAGSFLLKVLFSHGKAKMPTFAQYFRSLLSNMINK